VDVQGKRQFACFWAKFFTALPTAFYRESAMGFCSRVADFPIPKWTGMVFSLALIITVTGCQTPQPGLGDRISAHAANVDFSGLSADFVIPQLNVRAAIPRGWDAMPGDSSPLYVHQQWRSPEHTTGVGVAYIHMPLPMSAKALVWLARTQYSKQTSSEHSSDAHMLGEWTDSLGREWFEGENVKYHVKGYVVTNGLDAWAVYSGYRLKSAPNRNEINMAFRSMDSIVPLPLSVQVTRR
jgi:hypothetical protein